MTHGATVEEYGMFWPAVAIISRYGQQNSFVYLSNHAELEALALGLLREELAAGGFGREKIELAHIPTPEEIKALPEWASPSQSPAAMKRENNYQTKVQRRRQRVVQILARDGGPGQDQAARAAALRFVEDMCRRWIQARPRYSGYDLRAPFMLEVHSLEYRILPAIRGKP